MSLIFTSHWILKQSYLLNIAPSIDEEPIYCEIPSPNKRPLPRPPLSNRSSGLRGSLRSNGLSSVMHQQHNVSFDLLFNWNLVKEIYRSLLIKLINLFYSLADNFKSMCSKIMFLKSEKKHFVMNRKQY